MLKAYRIQVTGGDMKLIVHHAAEWVQAERLLEYDLLPADVEIAEKIRSMEQHDFNFVYNNSTFAKPKSAQCLGLVSIKNIK